MADMKKGQVTLRGRFSPGTRVKLVQVAGEHVLRSAAGRLVDVKKVNDEGEVRFTGLEVGARFFVVGRKNGVPLEARATARAEGEREGYMPQAPVQVEPKKLAGFGGNQTHDEFASGKVPQASDTPLGTATPVASPLAAALEAREKPASKPAAKKAPAKAAASKKAPAKKAPAAKKPAGK